MTATNNKDDAKAAAFFTGVLTLCAGGAGFLIAGIVLGIDYLLHGQPDERDRLEQARAANRRTRYDDALAWLEADRLDRVRARKARRDWFEADRATRGDGPSSGETLGRVLGRAWNHLVVGIGRFLRGWRDGRDDARRRRDNGDPNWWRPNPQERDDRADPEISWKCPLCGTTIVAAGDMAAQDLLCQDCRDNRARPHDEQPATTDQPKPDKQPEDQPNPVEEVIDAEVIEDPAPAEPSNPAGEQPTRTTSYDQQLEELAGEVQETRATNPADPSPPLEALPAPTR